MTNLWSPTDLPVRVKEIRFIWHPHMPRTKGTKLVAKELGMASRAACFNLRGSWSLQHIYMHRLGSISSGLRVHLTPFFCRINVGIGTLSLPSFLFRLVLFAIALPWTRRLDNSVVRWRARVHTNFNSSLEILISLNFDL